MERFGWSLFEIDQTDFESLLRFVFHAAQQAPKENSGKAFARKPAAARLPGQKFCDEVRWL